MVTMQESDKSGQRLLLAAIKLGTARTIRDAAVDGYFEASEEYEKAFKEYVKIVESETEIT